MVKLKSLLSPTILFTIVLFSALPAMAFSDDFNSYSGTYNVGGTFGGWTVVVGTITFPSSNPFDGTQYVQTAGSATVTALISDADSNYTEVEINSTSTNTFYFKYGVSAIMGIRYNGQTVSAITAGNFLYNDVNVNPNWQWIKAITNITNNQITIKIYGQNGSLINTQTSSYTDAGFTSTKIALDSSASGASFDNVVASTSAPTPTPTPTPTPQTYTSINISSTSTPSPIITTANINSTFYVTDTIGSNDWSYGWSWWGWLIGNDFYMYVTDPSGSDSAITPLYTQIGNQWAVNESSCGSPFEFCNPNPLYGNYTFKVKRYWNDSILAQSNITLTNSSGNTPVSSYSFNFSNNLPNDPNVFGYYQTPYVALLELSTYPYNFTLGNNWSAYTGSPNLLSDHIVVTGNGSINLGQYMLLRNYPVLIRGWLCTSYNYTNCQAGTLGIDYHYYNPTSATPTGSPTPTIPPTPIPTISPIPTITPPTPTPTPIPTITPQPTSTNYSGYSGTGTEGTLGNIGNISKENLGKANNISSDVNKQIGSYNYSTSKSVYGFFLPAIFNMIPAKIWGLIILGWALEISLILLRR